MDSLSEKAQELADGLTAAQREYAMHVLEGKSKKESYQLSYPGCTDKSAVEGGSRLSRHPKVQALLRQCRDDEWSESWLSRSELLAWLSDLVRSPEERTADRLNAASQFARLTGIEERQETSVGGPLLELAEWIADNRRPIPRVASAPDIPLELDTTED